MFVTFETERSANSAWARRRGNGDDCDDNCDYDDAAPDMILLIMVNFDTECSASSACARRGDGDDDRQDGDSK